MSSTPGNSGSGGGGSVNNAMPPSGVNNGHRKSSSLNRGWFEGTMEVISGMAPRPVTPSHQNTRPASAPNSPARGLGMGLFGGRNSPHHHFPPQIDRTNSAGSAGGIALPNFPINRLPSQDSLDRSIHNESGHGKSVAQIVRDLKHHNSTLSAKMASLEKRHMNELAEVEAASSAKRQELEQISAKQKMKLMQYEQYKAAAESKMKQQDAELSKVKEESAFQRHTISDLKSQLYELQQELDERDAEVENDEDDLRRPHSDDGRGLPLHPGHSRSNSGGSGLVIPHTSSSMSTDDFQQMALDNEELVKEVQELQEQLMAYQGYDKKLKDLQRQLEAAQKPSDAGIPPRPTTPTHSHMKNQPERERPPLAPSKSRDQDDASVSSVSSSDLYRRQLQDAKDELDAQTVRLNQHESSVRDLEAEKLSLVEAHSRRVQELEDSFAVLEAESKARESALRNELASLSQQEVHQIEERLREEHQGQVVELEEQLEQYAEKLAEVAATLAESRQQAKNQEQYRKDEAEDLRMIQDAHEAEIVRLEKELDEATKELELRDVELEEVKQKYLSSTPLEKEDEKKIEETEMEESNLKQEEAVKKLEEQLVTLRKEHSEAVAKLEAENTKLSNDLETAQKSGGSSEGRNPGSPGLHQYWEEKTSKSKEVGSLKEEIESLRQRVQESTEAGKLAEQKVHQLETQLQKVRSEEMDSNLASTQTIESEEQILDLKKKIDELNNLSVENENVKKELQEAKAALVTLDDDKKAMHDELNALVSSLEKEKELQNQMTAQLENQEAELAELQDIKNRLKPLEAEKLRLQDEVEKLKLTQNDSSNGDQIASQGVSGDLEDVRKNLGAQIEDLNEENSLLKNKLQDRDTTIATLLRSSIVLENKIESLQAEIDESKAKYQQTIDALQESRSTQLSREEEYLKTGDEITYLQGQLKLAKADVKRWKRALKEDGTTSGEYRYQIAMLQKANDDFAETVQERDQAIQNLINQSMGQETHIRELKMRISSLMKEVESVRLEKGRKAEHELLAEIERLQEESEIFAGQIIEQDEEFKRMQRVLKKRDEKITAMKTEIEVLNQNGNVTDKSILQDRDRQISELEKKIESLESQESDLVDPSEMKNLRAELDEMQEAAESNRVELRDLRQQLWEAKDAAGAAGDLRVELDQTRREFKEYKLNSPEKPSKDVDMLKSQLKELETELQSRETVIEELRGQVSNVCTDNEQTGDLSIKNKDLESKLQAKQVELEALTRQLDASQSQMDSIQKQFIGLQDDLKANKKQLKEATDVKAKLGNELLDSQARLCALEKELTNAITETSSNEELSRKNQVLVQENASLAQKNNVLAKENADLGSLNDNLMEESETLTRDNQVLCEELRALSEQKTKEAVEQFDALQQKVEDLARTSESLASENKELVNTVLILKQKNADMEKRLQSPEVEQLKMELHASKLEKESLEKEIMAKYEKQFQSLVSSKDAEMDSLRHSLTQSREKNSEDVEEVIAQMKHMEEESLSLRQQFQLEMQAKDQQIYALEHTLHAQEQIVDTMRAEMDQIQTGMEHATRARRNEVEEMQQEVMQVEGKAMKQEREIVALKMQLEEKKLEHKADVVKLKDALAKAMEQDSPLKQTISDLQNNDRMLEVRERLEQLKARNTSLQEENLNLGGRLERAAIQIKTYQLQTKQAEEIEAENLNLRNQLKEYEQLLSKSSKAFRKAAIPKPSTISSPVSDETAKAKDKKKKKFGLFKRKGVDESISEGKEGEEC